MDVCDSGAVTDDDSKQPHEQPRRQRPAAVAFDVLHTIFSLRPLRQRLQTLGLPELALDMWLLRTLRDGLTAAAAGTFRRFDDVAAETLTSVCIAHGIEPGVEVHRAALRAFTELVPHADAGPALDVLHRQGLPLYALTSGGAETTATLLREHGLARYFQDVISIDDVRQWKPRGEVYRYAIDVAGLDDPSGLAMIAAHPWDVCGAKCAGLYTLWVRRRAVRHAVTMDPPDASAEGLLRLCDLLLDDEAA